MGACMSSSQGVEISEEDKRLHREAEKALKEVRSSFSVRFTVTEVGLSSFVVGEIEIGLAGQGTVPVSA